jgi:septum site-determining protein MinD
VKDKRAPGLALLAAAPNRIKKAVSPEQMKQLSTTLTKGYDYVIIDSPAGIEMGFQNAIAAAQEAIIITTPEIAAVRDADRVVGLLEAQGIKRIHLIINRLRPAMVQDSKMMSAQDVKELLAIPLMGVIPNDDRVIISTNRGEPLVLSENPSLAGKAFHNIARRLEGETVEFLDLNTTHDNIFSRIRKRVFH